VSFQTSSLVFSIIENEREVNRSLTRKRRPPIFYSSILPNSDKINQEEKAVTLSRISKIFAATSFFVLCLFPRVSFAESLSESVAAFLVTERNFRVPPGSAFPSASVFPEEELSPFTETAQPIGVLQFGNLNLTTYANSRPSLSYKINKNINLRVKASGNSTLLQIRFRF
jgi:hypothetical protein